LPPKTAVVVVILVAVVVAAKVGFTDVELKVVKLCAAP
jgi:hypothetical protein